MIIFYFDSWHATDFLTRIITNIYSSFVFAEILTSFQNHFIFFCKFVIHYSIYISWFNSDHSIAKWFNSLRSNNNFSRHSLYIDCHENEIIYHWKRHRNLLQFYILVFITWSEIHFFFRNARENNTTNTIFNKVNKNVKINWNDQFS